MKKTKEKKELLVRISSRIRKDQHLFAKNEAISRGISEGEMHREIFDYYINNFKK